MDIDKNEAALALAAIDAAGARSAQMQRYRRFAPFLILWGGIWLVANSLTDLAPPQVNTIWMVLAVLPAADGRQQDTFLSMFWTFLYMAVGAWAGWRLFVIGCVGTSLILAGYFGIHSHYFLYMGCVSGGALITGGFWLRRL